MCIVLCRLITAAGDDNWKEIGWMRLFYCCIYFFWRGIFFFGREVVDSNTKQLRGRIGESRCWWLGPMKKRT